MQNTASNLDKMIRPRKLAERLDVSTTTLWRMRRRQELPEPYQISRGAVGWKESDIESWIASRKRVA